MTNQEKIDIKYLNSTVVCRLAPSKIHKKGIGVIAIQDIPKGTRIDLKGFGNYIISNKAAKKLKPEILHIILDRHLMCGYSRLETLEFQHPNQDADLQTFMNHSNRANTNGHTTLRKVKKGTELTENYSKLGWGNSNINPLQTEYLRFVNFK